MSRGIPPLPDFNVIQEKAAQKRRLFLKLTEGVQGVEKIPPAPLYKRGENAAY
jgi:hypothetical protein